MANQRNRLSKPLRRAVHLLIAAFVVVYLVVPQIAGARKALSLLAQVNVAYIALGVLLEAAAIAAYAQITRAVLGRRLAPGVGTVMRIQLATKAVTNVVPGGSAAGGALGYKLLKETGVPGSDAAFAVAMQGLGSAVVLNVLLWLGLVVSIPLRGLHPLFGTAAMVGVLLFVAFGTLVSMLTYGEDHSVRILRAIARRLPLIDERSAESVVRRLAERLRELASEPRRLLRGVAWSVAFWLLDAASLWIFLAAFGHRPRPDALIVAFGLAYVLAAIPITPGGLGVVEAVLTASLVGFGAARGVAILGVITYRLVNFWLPIPIGALAYLSLQFPTPGERERRAVRLRQLAEESFASADDAWKWAERHGVRVPHLGHHATDGKGDEKEPPATPIAEPDTKDGPVP